jgi:predicted phosphodiesterase
MNRILHVSAADRGHSARTALPPRFVLASAVGACLVAFLPAACSQSEDAKAPSTDLSAGSEDGVAGELAPGDTGIAGDGGGRGDAAGEHDGSATAVPDAAGAETAAPPPLASFIKTPWLQWPVPGGVTFLAETKEEVPLLLKLSWTGGGTELLTTPVKMKFDFMGIEMPTFAGWFHEVVLPVPPEQDNFDIEVVNGDFVRHVEMPQSVPLSRMILFGDTRTDHAAHQAVADLILAEQAPLVLQTGDLTEGGSILTNWDKFFEIEGPMLWDSFYFPTFGNHEAFGEGYFEALFESGNNHLHERNWWIDLRDLGIINIDQYATNWASAEAKAWFEDAAAKLADKQWLFVSMHEPFYTFSNHLPWSLGRTHVQPLIEKHGVDLVVSGHNHLYERFEVNGIPYIVTGGGGAPLYGPDEATGVDADYLVVAASMHHYVRLDFGPSSIHVTVVNSDTNEVFEELDVE